MATPIRTEVSIAQPGECPVAEASRHVDGPINDVARTTITNGDGAFVEEFTADGTIPPSAVPGGPLEDAGEDEAVYRYEKDTGHPCVCSTVENHGCPVNDVQGRDGELLLTFHAPEVETVRDIVDDLERTFDSVEVRRLAQAPESDGEDAVSVDRGRLTDRQREVMRTAHEMGYFEYPRDSNATEVAAELDIAPSTFSEHLAAAQGKLMDAVLDG